MSLWGWCDSWSRHIRARIGWKFESQYLKIFSSPPPAWCVLRTVHKLNPFCRTSQRLLSWAIPSLCFLFFCISFPRSSAQVLLLCFVFKVFPACKAHGLYLASRRIFQEVPLLGKILFHKLTFSGNSLFAPLLLIYKRWCHMLPRFFHMTQAREFFSGACFERYLAKCLCTMLSYWWTWRWR